MAKTQRTSDLSPNQRALRRLLRNPSAVAGGGFIAFAVAVAVFGYFLAPDSTPAANDQVNEIRDANLGFSIQMLKVRKNRAVEPTSVWQRLLSGTENPYTLVPFTHYVIKGDSIHVARFQGIEEPPKMERFSLVEVIFPLSSQRPDIESKNGKTTFYDIDNKAQTVANRELQRIIQTKHIVRKTYWLGTDHFGRDMLSRLIIGVRVSLLVGSIAVLISLTIGIALGALAGYYGGKTDDLISFLINTVWSVPTLLLVFALVIALGRGFWQIFIAVGLTMWVDVARIVRGQVLSLKTVQFVEAARSFGFSNFKIIFQHILPNLLGPVLVVAAANFATAILLESGLSYLGFGIQPPHPSWGNMLKEGYGYFVSSNIYPALFPGVAIMLMVLAFNVVGNGLRDALDVKSRV